MTLSKSKSWSLGKLILGRFSYPQPVDNFGNKRNNQRKRYEMMTKIKPHGPLPSQAQLAYLGDELAAFIHFGPITFYDQEWGTGQEAPEHFNPTKLDAREWSSGCLKKRVLKS